MENSELRVATLGIKTMGGPLRKRLLQEGYDVAFSCNSKNVLDDFGAQTPLAGNLRHPREIARALDPMMEGVQVAFLAIPSGEEELPLIEYFLDRGVYTILFCKYALANHYEQLRPRRFMIGANATLGGRTLSLPWLRMQYLGRKKFVAYAYWNASTNSYMDGVSRGGSQLGEFAKAQDLHLAEPGSTDHIEFLNNEIGGDYRFKASIAMNDGVFDDGTSMTANDFHYESLTQQNVQDLTMMTSNLRYIMRIDNMRLRQEFDDTGPGSLRADVGQFAIRGGFLDMSRENNVTKWIKGDAYNGAMIRFEGAHSDEGTIQLTGLGAGTATVGAAMNDLYQYQQARAGKLIESQWPKAA